MNSGKRFTKARGIERFQNLLFNIVNNNYLQYTGSSPGAGLPLRERGSKGCRIRQKVSFIMYRPYTYHKFNMPCIVNIFMDKCPDIY